MRLISVAVPVTFSGEIIGSVYLAESINTIDDTVRTTRNSLIVFSTLIVILIGMLSLGMSYIELVLECVHKSTGKEAC